MSIPDERESVLWAGNLCGSLLQQFCRMPNVRHRSEGSRDGLVRQMQPRNPFGERGDEIIPRVLELAGALLQGLGEASQLQREADAGAKNAHERNGAQRFLGRAEISARD